MLVAMEQLVGKEIAASVAFCEARNEISIRLDHAQGRHVILHGGGEQFRPGAVVRGSQNYEKLRRLASHQFVICVSIGRAAAARIDMRRDQTGGRRMVAVSRAASGTLGRIEEGSQFFAQLARVSLVAKTGVNSGTLAAGVELIENSGAARGEIRAVQITRLIQSRDQFLDFSGGQHFTELARVSLPKLRQRVLSVKQGD